MDYLKEFHKIMEQQSQIALATCVDNTPNVRIVNFYYDRKKEGILYFSTFRNNPKVWEFSQNDRVSFTTIPPVNNEHVRTKKAEIKKSDLTIFELQEGFTDKIPEYKTTIDQVGDMLDLYEVSFKSALVTLDFEKRGEIAFS